jgi:hypothetical protein
MAYRQKMSRRGSRKSFARGALSVQSVNHMTNPMRGGYRF